MIGLGVFVLATITQRAPVPFPLHLATTHKFPEDPASVRSKDFSPELRLALEHLSNRLWSVPMLSDHQFHPEMELISAEFAIWVNGLQNAYGSLTYNAIPSSMFDKVSKELRRRTQASDKHLKSWENRMFEDQFFTEGPNDSRLFSDYQFAYQFLYNEQTWMGTKLPLKPMTRQDLAEWLQKGFQDQQYAAALKTRPKAHASQRVTRGEAVIALSKASQRMMLLVNPMASLVESMIPASKYEFRFIKIDPKYYVAYGAHRSQSGMGLLEAKPAPGSKASKLYQARALYASFEGSAGDYYSPDLGITVHAPIAPMFLKDGDGYSGRASINSGHYGWGMVPKMPPEKYKSFVAKKAGVDGAIIQSDSAHERYAFLWRDEFANQWSVASNRYWTFYAYAKGKGAFDDLDAPYVDPWIYYSRP